jgi:hypothetical protein
MVEYCMLEGVNDSIETAHTLGKLLHGRSVHVNLIPYNTTEVGAQFRSPSPEQIRAFHAVLREPYNLKVTIRENHGNDIDGACGQLALKNKPQANGELSHKDIEDLGRKTPTTPVSPKKPSPSKPGTPSLVDTVNSFIDRHQQAIGYSFLCASVVCFGIGFSRQLRK